MGHVPLLAQVLLLVRPNEQHHKKRHQLQHLLELVLQVQVRHPLVLIQKRVQDHQQVLAQRLVQEQLRRLKLDRHDQHEQVHQLLVKLEVHHLQRLQKRPNPLVLLVLHRRQRHHQKQRPQQLQHPEVHLHPLHELIQQLQL